MAREGINLPPSNRLWNPLSEDEMDVIEETSYKILREIGFSSNLREILDIGKKAGCEVNYEKSSIKFPESIVEEYVKKAPKNFLIAGRQSSNDLFFEPMNKGYFIGGLASNKICAWDDQKNEYVYRESTLKDLLYSLKFMESSDHIDALFAPPLTPVDLVKNGLPEWVHMLNSCLNGCTKNAGRYSSNISYGEWDYFAKLAGEVVGGVEELKKRPIFMAGAGGIAPGNIHKVCGWNMLGSAKYNIPSHMELGTIIPTSTPMTLASFLSISLEQQLGMIALQEANKPGIPVICGTSSASMNLYTGSFMAAPEDLLARAARTQLYHKKIGLPTMTTYIGNAKLPNDIQSIYEQVLCSVFHVLSGQDAATLSFSSDAFNAEGTVLGDEVIEYMKQMMDRYRDLEPTSENLAYEIIKATGPMGSFLKHKHTLKNMNLQYKPKYSETRPLNLWLNDKKTMFDRVRERVKKIEKFETPSLPKDVQERMEKVILEANQKFKRY